MFKIILLLKKNKFYNFLYSILSLLLFNFHLVDLLNIFKFYHVTNKLFLDDIKTYFKFNEKSNC